MGEWSKTLGEIGESIVGRLLTLIGWGESQTGVPIPCRQGEKHQTSGTPRQTHGIDRLLSYKCPLVDGLLQILIISVKYSDKAYLKNPVPVFKSHLADLANTVDCFKTSDARHLLITPLSGIRKSDDVGVLFWLNNDKTDTNSILPSLAVAQLPEELNFGTVYVVDNFQAAFLYDAISDIRHRFKDFEVSFFYPDTGKNTNSRTRATSGPFLPVEHVSSSVLSLRALDPKTTTTILILALNENFSEDALQRLAALAQTLSQGWASKVELGFAAYDETRNNNEVQRVKALFPDKVFTTSLSVFTYRPDFRTIEE